jgi:hypothetical protein
MSLLIVLTVILLLTLTEDQPFIRLAFEAVSAFATVGLSDGHHGVADGRGQADHHGGDVHRARRALHHRPGGRRDGEAQRYRLAREDCCR